MKSKAEVVLEDVLNMMKDLTAIQRDLLLEIQALEIRVYILENEITALENRGLRKIWSWLSRTAKSVARKLS